MTTAYPLQWPEGWPRTDVRAITDGKYRFARSGREGRRFWSFGEARDKLMDELRQLGAINVVISSNFKTDRYGTGPVDSGKRPLDQGIAVYFMLGGETMAMARDAFSRAEENMRSLTLAIEAMRQLDRHGGSTMMRRAFSGFTALPAPKTKPMCWEILGVHAGASAAVIEEAFREKAKKCHPDNGGTEQAMMELLEARSTALEYARHA